MAKTRNDIIQLLRMIVAEHEDYWSNQRAELKRYRDAYENKFWNSEYLQQDGMIRVETADCFSYIEGFIASLFSRQPAVVVGKDSANPEGNAKVAQEIVNRFLFDQREQLEIASRLALIYPNSFLKLSPSSSDDMLDKVQIRALPPWEVITDFDACSFDTQRFTGHTYFMTVSEARERFGNKTFNAIPKRDYFSNDLPAKINGNTDLPDEYLYISIVELYDLSYDQLYIWSPNWKNGDDLLEKSEIPIRTYDDKPLSPLCPLYYSRKPERPMCGLSAVSRVYDQFYEKNILRTYWANAVRRDSRQYLYKEGALDEEALAKITSGIDGAMIPVDEQTLAGVIQPVGVEPISTDFDRYLAAIENDINRGSILAPFSRGEATKATATEITALAQYSASEIGKMARERDNAIENLSRTYIRIVSLLSDENERAVIEIDNMPHVISPTDLEAKFKIVALDQSSTPLSETIKRNNLIQLIPVLAQLGVQPDKIKEEIVRLYDLPKSFLEVPQQQPQGGGSLPSANIEPQQTGDIGPGGQLPAQQLAQSLVSRGGRA